MESSNRINVRTDSTKYLETKNPTNVGFDA